jgi:hypothetical protein
MQGNGNVNRFDLEQAIMACYNTTDDLELVSESILEGELDKDKAFNALAGIQELNRLRCDKVFSIFEEMVRSGQFILP